LSTFSSTTKERLHSTTRDETSQPRNPAFCRNHTVPHEPWQQKNLRLHRPCRKTPIESFETNRKLGTTNVLKVLLVEKKKPRTWGLAAVSLFATLRCHHLLTNFLKILPDTINSAIDYDSECYQISLTGSSRDLTAFLGKVPITRYLLVVFRLDFLVPKSVRLFIYT
jgi:hypothetical protein